VSIPLRAWAGKVAKNTRDQKTRTAQLAQPFRELLKGLIRERIKTEADKRELAKFLDRSVSFVNQLIYHGEGGLDAWIGALTFAYQLDSRKLAELFDEHTKALRRMSPLSDADKLWFEFDSHMTHDEKYYWVNLIRVTLELESKFGVKRVYDSKKEIS